MARPHLDVIASCARELVALRDRAKRETQEARIAGRSQAFLRGLVCDFATSAANLGDLILEELAARDLAAALEEEAA